MDTTLWNNVANFNIDGPVSEYGFITRLQNENFWTVNFACEAIAEYKKFMYLAAVSDGMVSPSDVVDIVWHQHLIFTQSYNNFCSLLGKQIAHIPSTHNRNDFSTFKTATERTKKLYLENFGPQPVHIWGYANIYQPLGMETSPLSMANICSVGVLLVMLAFIMAYYFLSPLYITIGNPYFIEGYLLIAICGFIIVNFYNYVKLNAIVSQWPKDAFIFKLSALELVYLQKNNIVPVIHGAVNQLILAGNITILENGRFRVKDAHHDEPVLYCVLQTISINPNADYPAIVNLLKYKPAFNKTSRAMDAFTNYVSSSKKFVELFILNFSIFSIMFLLGAVRLATGIVRDKPVTQIAIVLAMCLAFAVLNLHRLSTAIGTVALPKYYSKNIVYQSDAHNQWDWKYFLLGDSVFVSAFVPLTTTFNNSDGSFSSTDSSSSCGSGGSCGGCGGD
ncbi:hypothetical protein BDD43_5967 [Mucilaginibacter gracilis]|uniref:TIGR04222 domain-containing protein n=1 Tax=Mucilaginibacter gracilis TaxID=423350 RepID=A0A495J9J7_9SPHI|nr:hypothetical protein [Mucilaginibacter gracilis]RKR85696.1 hypothetical protein BDD43_5967 [Mucilaginibacter gracilis]